MDWQFILGRTVLGATALIAAGAAVVGAAFLIDNPKVALLLLIFVIASYGVGRLIGDV